MPHRPDPFRSSPMSRALGRTVLLLRKQDKITQRTLAHVGNISVAALSRFEKKGQWPGSALVLDHLLGAVAYLSTDEQINTAADVWLMTALMVKERERREQDKTRSKDS